MAPTGRDKRLRVLHLLNRQGPHSFMRLRRLAGAFTLVTLFGVPLSGLARFDVWGGHHMAAGQPVNGVTGLSAVGGGILGFYLITFLINWAFGRLFCGFGCPVGQVSRFADAAQVRPRRGCFARGVEVLYALTLAAAFLSWWVSPAVFVVGSAAAIATTIGALLATAAAILLHGRLWRWSFCRRWCPIGLYYSAVQLPHRFGVQFRAAEVACDDCDLCAISCPVDLDPRHLGVAVDDIGALAIDGFPGRNHCLTCGDCVRACEHNHRKHPEATPPLTLRLRPEDRSAQ